MGSPFNLQSPASAASGAVNTTSWWALMDDDDSVDDYVVQHPRQPSRRKSRSRSSYGSPSYHPETPSGASRKSGLSSSRRSSAPLPQPPASASQERMMRSSTGISQQPSKRSMGTPRSSSHNPPLSRNNHHKSLETPRRSISEKSATRHSSSSQQPQYSHHHHHHNRPSSHRSSSIRNPSSVTKLESTGLGPSLDEEDSEQKRIRWETPTTHRYQLNSSDQPRLLEEKFLNVLDSMPNMVCSHQGFEKPLMGVPGGNMMWNLLDGGGNQGRPKSGGSSGKKESGTGDDNSNSQSHSSDDNSIDSVFEDGPSVVHVSSNLPIFSESITASESLLSGSDSDEENDGSDDVHRRHHNHNSKHDSKPMATDTSQILDDLSGMESERSRDQQKSVEDEVAPLRDNNHTYNSAGDIVGGQEPIVVSNQHNRPPVKIYNTSMPFETAGKEKKCIVSVGKLQDMHKARSGIAKLRSGGKKNDPPIPDISVGVSNEISTMSASEDSYMHRIKMDGYRTYKQERAVSLPVGSIPENKGLRIESNANILFDSNLHDETRSCMPIRLQRKRRGADGATASASSKSLGLRFMSRSGDANTTSEKENDEDSPYVYEYDTGMNTYVAYFEIPSPKETRPNLQVIEHPNPPMLPFGSNEVVVKIEASTISQSDCAIRRGEWWGGTLSLPRIPGVAFAGKIDQIHKEGRNSMQRGDQVVSLVCSGSNSRYVCIPRERLVKVPNNCTQSSAKIACIPEIYLSAFQALHVGQSNGARYKKNSLSGKAVMFIGGATAFGQAIVELSIEAGASVVYATASKVKQFQRIIELGGIPLSDNPTEWLPSINQTVDILIGSTNESFKDTDPLNYDHLNVLKKKGQLVLLGGPGAPNDYPVIHPGKTPCLVDVFKILKRAHKHNVFESWERDMKQSKRDLVHLLGLLHKGVLKPKILEKIPLSKVSKAEEIVEARRLHGVIICEPWIQERQQHQTPPHTWVNK